MRDVRVAIKTLTLAVAVALVGPAVGRRAPPTVPSISTPVVSLSPVTGKKLDTVWLPFYFLSLCVAVL